MNGADNDGRDKTGVLDRRLLLDMPEGFWCVSVSVGGVPSFRKNIAITVADRRAAFKQGKGVPHRFVAIDHVWDSWQWQLIERRYGEDKTLAQEAGFDSPNAAAVSFLLVESSILNAAS